ncbi:MAG: ABC transporter substrate-binding protein [Bdellovibrionales bacterium]|nr:ABC transporter substrate-binding protein [Bdellovibrionales bacterium]
MNARGLIPLCLLVLVGILPARAADKLTLQLRWYHQFQFAGYYAAQMKGYYRQAGVDLEILEGRPGLPLRDFVLDEPGRISIGGSGLILDYARGQPVVILEPIFQHGADVLISLESRGIRTPADLIGKTVADRLVSVDPFPGFRGALLREGLNPDQVKWISNTWNVDDLLSGKVDAMSAYVTTQVQELKRRGIPIRTLSPLDYGIDLYGDVLFTSAETARLFPKALRGFEQATARGWIYAFEHPEEIIDAIEKMPTRRSKPLPRDLFVEEARETRKLVEPDLIPIGYSNPGRWERIIELYKKIGVLPPGDLDTGALFFPDEGQERTKLIRRLLQILALLTFLGSIAAIWILLLRRQVAKKTQAVQEAMRRAMDQQADAERSNRVKSLFLANMSHEIRTPLTAILGFSELLRKDDLSAEERANYLRTIERTGQSLSTILSDILDLSKVDAERLEIRPAPVSLRALLSDVEAVLRLRAEPKGIALEFRVEDSVPDRILTDGIRLKQIALNVAGNAVKFTERGTVTVIATSAGETLDLRVEDTGPGIAEADRSKLFESFSQVDSSIRRSYGGTGLGLALSRKLARLLGGDVELESSVPGRGSVFRVRVSAPPVASERATDPSSTGPLPGLGGKRILVVDDCEDNQTLVRIFLEKAGATVRFANHGEEALALAAEEVFDLVFMDVQMPVMDGYAAATAMRERGLRFPIIALTANAMQEDAELYRRSGCDAFLAKPVRQAELLEAAARALG